jgi:hypothetical protein
VGQGIEHAWLERAADPRAGQVWVVVDDFRTVRK